MSSLARKEYRSSKVVALPYAGLAAAQAFKEPPSSPQSESNLINAVLADINGEALALAVQCGVKALAFAAPINRTIWQAIEDLKARGSAITPDTLIEELRLSGDLDDLGGWDAFGRTLIENSANVLLPSQVRYHAEQIVLYWQLRHTLTLANDLSAAVLDFQGREQFAERVGEIGQKFIRFGRTEAVRTLDDQIESVKKDVAAMAAGKEDRSRWVYTGLPTFDKRLRPLNSARLDGLTVLAGASGHGKSAGFRQVTWQKIQAGGRVVVYTRETDIESFIEQMMATVCEIDLMNLPEYARLYPERIEKFGAECDRLIRDIANKRLWVVQHEPATPLETIEDLAQHYRAHSHLHGHPDMVVVDYLQLFGTKKRCNSREEVVATVSHALQALQRESGNLWFVGCQYNEAGIREMRLVRRDGDGHVIHRLPNAGDLRESQSIYHDADRVICLYRPPVDCRDQENLSPNIKQPEIWMCQIKRRKGGTGVVKCWFEARFTRFTELSREEAIHSEQAAAAPGQVPSGGMDKTEWKKRKKQ